MEVIPSEYQQLELSRYEKLFSRYCGSYEEFGFFLLRVNAAMIEDETQNVVICEKGILLLKFFDDFEKAELFSTVMSLYSKTVFKEVFDIVGEKFKTNKALIDKHGKLKVAYNYVCVFPRLEKHRVCENVDDELRQFIEEHCIFLEEFNKLRSEFKNIIFYYIGRKKSNYSEEMLEINEFNVNSILQRIAPEYTTIRVSPIENKEILAGVDNELLVVTEDDISVKAFMLDNDQLNIINKINKGDQLILACAGSGKSVLLISKCFKAARMNPDKKFLITCYSKPLQSLYSWYINRAGLCGKNVECITFHKLCKKLIENSRGSLKYNDQIETWPQIAINRYNTGVIKDRYYGIFIDEVQLFEQEWYKLCFDLVENRNSGEHLFVICGDKTQKIKKQQKRGKAPWNAGENYPNYRGGNKNIRIEKNYRNCLEINEFINRFVSHAKDILHSLTDEIELDPDMFLRGQAVRHGIGAYIKKIGEFTAKAEALKIIESIKESHDKFKIPYDEIAVVMYNKTYSKKMNGWSEWYYNLESRLLSLLKTEGIPHCMMYSNDREYAARYGDDSGVVMISFDSVLGLDFRSVIVCGLKPFGHYDKTKDLNIEAIDNLEEKEEYMETVRKNISMLYVACTRSRDVLYIIQPESAKESIYMKLLEDSLEN